MVIESCIGESGLSDLISILRTDKTSSYRYESIAWIPNVIAFITMLGVGGKLLSLAPLTGSSSHSGTSASVAAIISFATTLASTDLSWCTMVADYGVYHDAEASRYVRCSVIVLCLSKVVCRRGANSVTFTYFCATNAAGGSSSTRTSGSSSLA